jgi:hypothetical protein
MLLPARHPKCTAQKVRLKREDEGTKPTLTAQHRAGRVNPGGFKDEGVRVQVSRSSTLPCKFHKIGLRDRRNLPARQHTVNAWYKIGLNIAGRGWRFWLARHFHCKVYNRVKR